MRKILTLAALVILLTGCTPVDTDGFVTYSDSVSSSSTSDNNETEIATDAASLCSQSVIVVYVCGAVITPGVYELDSGSRIVDAVDAAGGFATDADTTYVNLAAPLSDGIKIVIPTVSQVANGDIGGDVQSFDNSNQSSNDSSLININTASLEELKTLPGIGDGIAGKIIDYRTTNGKFKTIEEIMLVPGIKEKLFSKIKDYITV